MVKLDLSFLRIGLPQEMCELWRIAGFFGLFAIGALGRAVGKKRFLAYFGVT